MKRLEECERNIIFMPSEVRLEIFFNKIKNKGPEIHYFALKLYAGASKLCSWASKSGGWGDMGPQAPLDLLVHYYHPRMKYEGR